MEWMVESGHAPGPRMQELMSELSQDDPNLADLDNRKRFVDACVEDAKANGMRFANEEELKVDALEYLNSLLLGT